ncbi:hypothetical protein GQE99_10270 [Maritimibacter sp. DP07]|uniref:TupA-like ATPgrasp n=2 Tax=Maritimibacter harenae TaxID=2606218 RepID=A0A845M9Z3_9RHOB|nr:hypothetical protein [Maritimibacter harenae]
MKVQGQVTGLNRIIHDLRDVDIPELCAHFNERLPLIRNAQGVREKNNVAIIEELLAGHGQAVPVDYKFHCFSGGQPGGAIFLQLTTGRFVARRHSYFDEGGTPVSLGIGRGERHDVTPQLPENIHEMFAVAKSLAEGFDYIRVDLYNVGGRIYFGEFSPFHQGGFGPVSSRGWDKALGDLWRFRLPAYQPQ